MRVLVTWGTKLGGTEGIARIVAEGLEHAGFEVTAAPAAAVRDASQFDAAIVGGALYANRWHRDARRFVVRNLEVLRRIPVWLFSSGPLDDSADRQELPVPRQVATLMQRVGARDHTTFGGRLAADARGFPAAAMAKTTSGDWRNPERIRVWTAALAHDLPRARPRPALVPPGGSLGRLVAHGVAGWALCAAAMALALRLFATGPALALHAALAPLIFGAVAASYFRPYGARDPLPTALAFAALVVALDAIVVAGLIVGSFAMFASVTGTWLPVALGFLATWLTGLVRSTMPWPRGKPGAKGPTQARGPRLPGAPTPSAA